MSTGTTGITTGSTQSTGFLARIAARLAEAATRARGLDRLELRFQHDEQDGARAIASTSGVETREERSALGGIAARAWAGGAIGHASRGLGVELDERRLDEAIEAAIRDAARLARARAAIGGGSPARELDEAPARGHYETPRDASGDADAAWIGDVASRLLAAAGAEGRTARAHATLHHSARAFAGSDGGLVTQHLASAGGGMGIVVELDGEREERSYPMPLEGGLAAGGAEVLRRLRLAESVESLADEARALVRAPLCPAGRTTIILSPEQLCLQLHESVGHALEGDRILGEERSFAGGSFVTPDMLGRFQLGSTVVNLSADATLPGAIGSFGWDDEGVPARRTPLVERGRLVGVLSTRRIAARFGLPRSGGCLRAASFRDAPILRMTNVVLEADPRGPSLADLIADTHEGIYLGCNRTWSIDDLRLVFELGCELAWEIRGGKRTRLLRRPMYRGRTPAFWNSCDAVAGPAEVRLHGLTSCGKGEPMQLIGVGHGGPPARFRDVEIGAST